MVSFLTLSLSLALGRALGSVLGIGLHCVQRIVPSLVLGHGGGHIMDLVSSLDPDAGRVIGVVSCRVRGLVLGLDVGRAAGMALNAPVVVTMHRDVWLQQFGLLPKHFWWSRAWSRSWCRLQYSY